MKRTIAAVIGSATFVALAVWATTAKKNMPSLPVVRADEGAACSLATVAGKYGFTLTGTLLFPTGPVPGGAVGRVTLDTEGNLSGTEARNVGGGFANETFTGTQTLGPNCTSTSAIQFFESGKLVRTSVITIVWDDNLNEFRFVQQSLVLPDGTNVPVVVTGDGRRINPTSGN